VLLALLPAATAVFDLVEGVSVYIALGAFPDSPQWVLVLASISGSLKHLGAIAAMRFKFFAPTEAALLLAFAWFWFIQTHDHRGTVPPPPAPEPDPMVGLEGDQPAEPEAGSAPTVDDQPVQTLPAEQQQ